jgi:hypothetical protein
MGSLCASDQASALRATLAIVATESETTDAAREASKPLPLQLELPAVPTKRAAERAVADARPPRERRRSLVRAGVALGVVAAIALIVVEVVLPWYLRRACIEAAAEHGIDLAIDAVRVGTGGFRLQGVHAEAAAIRGARVDAPSVEVETSGLRAHRLVVVGAELTLDGSWSSVTDAVARWRASPAGGQGGEWAPTALVVDGSRIVWNRPIGDNARVEASGVHGEIVWQEREPTVVASSDNLVVAVPGGSLGPWRLDLDVSAKSSRVRLAFDPGVPEACTLLVVGGAAGTTAVDVSIPRSPLARLGIPPRLVGLQGKDLQLAASAHYRALGPMRVDLGGKGGLYGIAAQGIPRPLDVAWDLTASGNGHLGVDVKDARLAVGPLVGALVGTLRTFDDGFRADLAWHAGPVPCAAFDVVLAPGQPFDIAYELRKLAQATGLTKVSGDVSASGALTFDSRDLGAAAVSFVPASTCQVAMFAP